MKHVLQLLGFCFIYLCGFVSATATSPSWWYITLTAISFIIATEICQIKEEK